MYLFFCVISVSCVLCSRYESDVHYFVLHDFFFVKDACFCLAGI